MKQDGALWFKATEFGDEKDRVVRRSNGVTTYFASDVAYHLLKFRQGFDLVVDIWGADHHGYVPRLQAAAQALGCPGRPQGDSGAVGLAAAPGGAGGHDHPGRHLRHPAGGAGRSG